MKKFFSLTLVLLITILISGCDTKKENDNQNIEKQSILQEENQKIEDEEVFAEQEEIVDSENLETVNEEDLVYYKIPELGIKFKIDKWLAKELIYYIKLAPDDSRFKYARLSNEGLSKLNEYCKAEYGALGTLVRVEGSPRDYDEPLNKIQTKNFYNGGDFFVYFSGIQTPCANQEEMKNYTGADFTSLFTNVLYNIKNLERIED